MTLACRCLSDEALRNVIRLLCVCLVSVIPIYLSTSDRIVYGARLKNARGKHLGREYIISLYLYSLLKQVYIVPERENWKHAIEIEEYRPTHRHGTAIDECASEGAGEPSSSLFDFTYFEEALAQYGTSAMLGRGRRI